MGPNDEYEMDNNELEEAWLEEEGIYIDEIDEDEEWGCED